MKTKDERKRIQHHASSLAMFGILLISAHALNSYSHWLPKIGNFIGIILVIAGSFIYNDGLND